MTPFRVPEDQRGEGVPDEDPKLWALECEVVMATLRLASSLGIATDEMTRSEVLSRFMEFVIQASKRIEALPC